MAKLPDFIIIGAMKTGSTVLWRNLNKHPDIVMGKNPDDPKKASTEIRFFSNAGPHHTWSKGIEWYRGLFSGECAGEKCANYVELPTAMKRIAKHIPDVKLIMGVRNPAERAYSEYQMQLHTQPGRYTSGFSKAFWADTGYQHRGKYFNLLEKNVLPYFHRNRIHIVVQEWMKADTDSELNKIYQFLGLDEHHLVVEDVKADDRDKEITDYKKWSTPYEPMAVDVRQKLLDFYRHYNDDLFEFLGYTIEEWD